MQFQGAASDHNSLWLSLVFWGSGHPGLGPFWSSYFFLNFAPQVSI
jgi:hypothetical protein